MAEARIPTAVYRLQFHRGMRFDDARGLVDYLHELGISDLYASPILQAKRGSTHGYDVTDPTHINPELGTEEEFESLSRQLQAHGMGLLLDIVPNHMAASSENPWWTDLLEEGPGSAYAPYFDVDWHPPSRFLENRILLPTLGAPYAEALEGRQLKLSYEEAGFFVHYFDTKLPVAVKPYRQILEHRLERLRQKLGPETAEYQELEGILSAIDRLPERSALLAERAGDRRLARTAIKERLWQLYRSSETMRRFIEQNVWVFNGKSGVPVTFRLLDRLMSHQAYVLSYWQNSNEGINYRRFFTITDLVGMRVEDPLTFDAMHSVILRLAHRGLVSGLRIDHIDGLRDPLGYLRRLQDRVANGDKGAAAANFYVVVEKILAPCEDLPEEWPVAGTTGYDFLNALNGIFVDERQTDALDDIYVRFSGVEAGFEELAYDKKKQVMQSLLAVEMNTLGRRLSLLAQQDRYARELPRSDLARALLETVAWLPVYRTYTRNFEVSAPDVERIGHALTRAEKANPEIRPACFDFLRQVLLLEQRPQLFPEQREARLAFVMRLQQFTGPLMAKGFEDCLLYIYNRLTSLNEVGGFPQQMGVSTRAFHDFGRKRQKQWPHTLNTTTTHDTKRAEDVRARIHVISEAPEEWETHLLRWREWNSASKRDAGGTPVPTPNEEYLLYQTMLGAWPLQPEEEESFPQRLQEYMIKAMREAMVHTKWTVPNVKHEKALVDFIAAILKPSPRNRFLQDFLRFQSKIAYHGALNGLAQVLIKNTYPGVPDLYQGSELWDLRLVDPDNRGPVDFQGRAQALQDAGAAGSELPLETLLERWSDGRIKLFTIRRSLKFRSANPSLYGSGDYIPLGSVGRRSEHVVGFARRTRTAWGITATPRLTVTLTEAGRAPLGEAAWGNTYLTLPRGAPRQWTNVLTGETLIATRARAGGAAAIAAAEIFRRFPAALLAAGSASVREAWR